ncbi:hypothetical protein JWG40_03730 [Leptospira sp. 201903074]|uniref:hypothetical protein n=1 Tax=Leptospira abararensis TaxID=2810036 RepID=UPI001963A338|nr:hypothetical protein [Leptospira abararensis]MBM9546110.1 hypothetical protein [Leptospira abararensis]
MNLFLTGFLQVLFVCANTYMISKQKYMWVLVFGFLISFIWSWNVRKIAFGNIFDRIKYSIGSAAGGGVGLFVSVLILGDK